VGHEDPGALLEAVGPEDLVLDRHPLGVGEAAGLLHRTLDSDLPGRKTSPRIGTRIPTLVGDAEDADPVAVLEGEGLGALGQPVQAHVDQHPLVARATLLGEQDPVHLDPADEGVGGPFRAENVPFRHGRDRYGMVDCVVAG